MHSTGFLGEKLVKKELRKRGHRILCCNFSVHGMGEIDIISKKGREVVFTEVKTRSAGYLYEPVYAVDRKKQSRIIRTAEIWLMKNKKDLQPRFDIAEVVLNGGEVESINIIENAFGA